MDSDQKKLEHLKLIQIVIERMARNSFLLKGWAVTLISALYVFVKEPGNRTYVLIGVLPCILFWYLDAYFLGQERLYRWWYDRVRQGDRSSDDKVSEDRASNGEHLQIGDFDLTPHRTCKPEPVLRTMFRDTIWPFYLTIAATTVVVWLVSQQGSLGSATPILQGG